MNLGQLIGELRYGAVERPRRPDAPAPQVRTIIREDAKPPEAKKPGPGRQPKVTDRVREYLAAATVPATAAKIAEATGIPTKQVCTAMNALLEACKVGRGGRSGNYAYYLVGGLAAPREKKR